MSYDVSTKKYSIAADVDALGTFLAQRQSDSATTNGGIVATGGSPTVPLLGADAPGLGLAYMKAQADAIMCATGYQGQSDAAGSADSTSSTSFVDVSGFSSYSFTAPLAKTYLVHVDMSCYVATAVNNVSIRLMKDGASVFDSPAARLAFSTLLEHSRLSFRCPVAMTVGANVLKLQWKVSSGAGSVNVDTSDFRCFTVSG